MFFKFLKLYKWYQIAQSITNDCFIRNYLLSALLLWLNHWDYTILSIVWSVEVTWQKASAKKQRQRDNIWKFFSPSVIGHTWIFFFFQMIPRSFFKSDMMLFIYQDINRIIKYYLACRDECVFYQCKFKSCNFDYFSMI